MTTTPVKKINHRKYWSLFLASWFFLALVVNICVRSLDRELRREGISSQIYVICRDVLIDAVDIETGLRGFLIAEKKEYLSPYYHGVDRIEINVQRLSDLINQDPISSKYLKHAIELKVNLIGEFSNQIRVFDEEGPVAARKRFLEYPTKPAMDDLRSALGMIQREEDNKLTQYIEKLEYQMNTTLRVLDISVVVVFCGMIAMMVGFLPPPMEDRWAQIPPPPSQ